MKPIFAIQVLTFALGGFHLSVSAEDTSLDWLLGCWTTEDGSSREVWVRQAEDQFIGFGVALERGNIVFHEVLSIGVDEAGVHYTAHPQGQSKTTFSTDRVEGRKAEFINPEHDYPQKISYRLEGDMLYASISMLDGEQLQTFDKVRCE